MTRRFAGPLHSGLFCPADRAHGPLLELADGSLACPHADHHGRPKTHPLGGAPETRALFTRLEAEEASEVDREIPSPILAVSGGALSGLPG